MGTRGPVCLLTLLLMLGGCGGDDDDSGSGLSGGTETQSDQVAAAQDAQAKSDARELVTYVEACFVDRVDYSGCTDAAGAEDLGAATVESADAATFTVVSPSESGNEFRLEKTATGALRRTCTEPGTGGCEANGRW